MMHLGLLRIAEALQNDLFGNQSSVADQAGV
jgi:hypothetical protein